MISSTVFMNRLRRIIADAALEDGTSLAVNMFRSYQRDLYSEFDIRCSNRLTRAVKTQVSDILAELRLEVLRVEFEATESSAIRAICSAVRWEIDMARRALALRHEVPDCEDCDRLVAGVSRQDCEHHAPAGVVLAFADPNPWLNRRRILQSMETLSRSRHLLARLRRFPAR
jgi:hypothetical protein